MSIRNHSLLAYIMCTSRTGQAEWKQVPEKCRTTSRFLLPRVLYLLNWCNLKLPKCNLYNVLDAHVHVHVVKSNCCLFHFINVQSLSLSVNSTFWTNNQSTTQFPMSYYHDQFAQFICISIFPINYRFFMCFYTFISSFKV